MTLVSMRELAAALFPPGVREQARYMTIFSTFLDASKEGPEKVYTIAGCFCQSADWDEFNGKWLAALGDFGIKHFHMKDFEGTRAHGGFGEFEGWARDDSRREPLLTSLVRVIADYTVGDVAFSMPNQLYADYVPAHIKKMVGGSPYYFLFTDLLVHAEKLMDTAAKLNAGIPPDWQMSYQLARGDEGAGAVIASYNSRRPDNKAVLKETRTVGVGLVDGENYNFPSLEAADMLAYEVRKQTGKQVGTNENPKTRLLFKALAATGRLHSWNFCDNAVNVQSAVDSIVRGSLGVDPDELWIPPHV